MHEYLRFHILYKHYFQHISNLDNKNMPFSVKKECRLLSFFFITFFLKSKLWFFSPINLNAINV